MFNQLSDKGELQTTRPPKMLDVPLTKKASSAGRSPGPRNSSQALAFQPRALGTRALHRAAVAHVGAVHLDAALGQRAETRFAWGGPGVWGGGGGGGGGGGEKDVLVVFLLP